MFEKMKATTLFKKIYALLFAALILLPLLTMNLTPEVASPLDNRMLAPYPESLRDWRLQGEDFLKDRIGFRDRMIVSYHTAMLRLFRQMEHPLFTAGENDHIFFGYEAYVEAFQSLDYTDEEIAVYVHRLDNLNEYLKSKQVSFLYVNFPDKKSVYPEYYSKTVYRQNKLTRNEAFLQALDTSDIPHLFLKDALVAAKSTQATYNQKFDPGHFNGYGAFIAHQEIAKKLDELFPGYPPLTREEVLLEDRQVNLAQYINIADSETVPTLALKDRPFEIQRGNAAKGYNYYAHNEGAPIQKTLLLFGDSYLLDADCYGPSRIAIDYYARAFRDVYLFSAATMRNIARYIDEYRADVLIYATAERVVPLSGSFLWDVSAQ